MKIGRYIGIVVVCLLSAGIQAVNPSGTLPIVYMTTNSGQPITDKENYVPGTVYIDLLNTGYAALGTSTAPLTAQLKGRGNWTWSGFDKKPYKIKFDVKQTVLGMPMNKHWVLIASADDWLGYLRNPVGFMISEAIGLRWTPGLVPIELVLNGKYQGLYFLTEHVRVGKNRVNIREQTDLCTNADSITGGWMVEIDNYWTENNIEFDENNGQHVMVSLDVPKVLSSVQRTYIVNQIEALNNAIYGNSSAALEQILDIKEAAKYYLVQEIMEDCESYHGSCKLYKDRDSLGTVDKWKFGPVWDFGNAYDRHAERWIYDEPTWAQYWIGQLATWPVFQNAVKEQWWIYYHQHKDAIRQQAIDFANRLTEAAKRDAQVWDGTSNFRNNSNMADRRKDFVNRYNWRINWLYKQWGKGIPPATEGVERTQTDEVGRKMLRDGQLIIQRGGKTYTIQGQILQSEY